MPRNNEAQIKVSVFNQDFNKKMKEMGKETNKLKQEFELQQEQMKHTATETEKFQAKMEYLQKAQALAAKKAAETEAQYQRVKAQFGENSQAAQNLAAQLLRAQTAEQRLANQITETNNELADQVQAAEKASKSLSEIGEGFKGTGESLSTSVTAPLVALGTGAIIAANDVESATGRIQAQLGITADKAQNLGEIAQDVWKNNFGENLSEVSDTMVKVIQNIGDLSDADLKNVTESAFTLSDAFGIDVGDAIKTAGNLTKNFDMDAQHAMDLITVGFQKGGDYSGELLDTLNEYSPQFGEMGISAENFLGILISGAENGAYSLDKVGDAVKEFNIRAQDGSDTTAEGFKAIGLDADKMGKAIASGGAEGEKAFQATIAALASMKDPIAQNTAGTALFGTQWEDLRSTVVTSMADGIGAIQNVDGATKKAGDALYDNFGSKLQGVLREAGNALAPLGEVLLGFAEDIIPKVSEIIAKVVAKFQEMSPAMQKITVIIGAIAAAIGPIIFIVGQLLIALGPIVNIFKALGPILFGAGEGAASLSVVLTTLTGPIGWVIAAVAGLIAIFVALWKNNEDFRNKVLQIWENIKIGFQQALTFISENVVKPIMSGVMSFFGEILGKIKGFWDENGQGIMTIVSTYFGMIWANIKMVMGIITGIFQAVWPIISGIVQVAWSLIKTSIKNAIDLILGIIQFFVKIFTGDWNGAFNTIKETASKIMNNILNTFKGIDLLQIGKDIVQGLINGLGSMIGAVKEKVKGIAKLIPEGVKDFLNIHSPSRVMMELGKYTSEGFLVGIQKKMEDVRKMSGELAKSISMPQMSVAAAGSVDVAFSAGQIESIQSAFNSPFKMPSTITVISELDGREVARNQYPFIDEIMARESDRTARFQGIKR